MALWATFTAKGASLRDEISRRLIVHLIETAPRANELRSQVSASAGGGHIRAVSSRCVNDVMLPPELRPKVVAETLRTARDHYVYPNAVDVAHHPRPLATHDPPTRECPDSFDAGT